MPDTYFLEFPSQLKPRLTKLSEPDAAATLESVVPPLRFRCGAATEDRAAVCSSALALAAEGKLAGVVVVGSGMPYAGYLSDDPVSTFFTPSFTRARTMLAGYSNAAIHAAIQEAVVIADLPPTPRAWCCLLTQD